jgi:sulfoxide reductase heme-binding subunit YedZ
LSIATKTDQPKPKTKPRGRTVVIVTKTLVWLACLTPLALLAWRGWNDLRGLDNGLGANPIETITHATGDWTLRLLLITLAITPIRKLAGVPVLIRYRRLLGLFAFFYGVLHLITYVWLDKFFALHEILKDIGKRRFITVGMAAFALLIPLAVTSTAGWIRRVGGRNWQRLHRLAYFSALGGVVHYYWLVKSDVRLPLMYGGILALLLGYRLVVRMMRG